MYPDCEGYFLTDPGSVRLYLNDIHDFFHNDFPLRAMIFLNSDVMDDSISHLVTEVITMTHVSVESSIIATNASEGETVPQLDSMDEVECPISIPINLDIAVDVICDEESDYEELYDATMNLFDNFNPSKIRELSNTTPFVSKCPPSQRKEYEDGFKFGGLKIQRPAIKSFPRKTVFTQDIYEDPDNITPVQGII